MKITDLDRTPERMSRKPKDLDPEELEIYLWLARDIPMQDALDLVNYYGIDEYKKRRAEELEKADLFNKAYQQRVHELKTKGKLSKYHCWKCKNTFQAYEKEPHICDKCNTDLDEE